jgi:hypothetical protein
MRSLSNPRAGEMSGNAEFVKPVMDCPVENLPQDTGKPVWNSLDAYVVHFSAGV